MGRYLSDKQFAGLHGLPSLSSLQKARSPRCPKRLRVPDHIRQENGRIVYDRETLKAWLRSHGCKASGVDEL